MTLDETIKDFEDKYIQELKNAEDVKNLHGKFVNGYRIHCKAANEYKQLADWLKELKSYRAENLTK